MNKKEYLKSFLKPGQKRLPRKLKKLYLKKFYEGGPTLIWNKEQFLNLYIRPNEEVIYQSINRLLNTPSGELQFKPSNTHDFVHLDKACGQDKTGKVKCDITHVGGSPKVTCELTDISKMELDNISMKGYLWN